MKVLVTGGFGFIGSHVVEHHLNKGDEVYVVDDLSTGRRENIELFSSNPNLKYEVQNVLTWPNITEVVGWADRIYHMAAVLGQFRVIKEPVNVISGNVAGTERLFRSIVKSGKKPRVIVASSSGVYGGSSDKDIMSETDNLSIESPEFMQSNYSISKLTDEIITLSYSHIHGIPSTLVRIFNTIGPRQTGSYGFVVPRFIEQATSDSPITIFGTGDQTRSFCDVRDVVSMLNLIANNIETKNLIFNVGADREVTIKELAQIVKDKAKSNSEFKFISYKDVYGIDFSDIMSRRPDLTRVTSYTNYKHQWTLEKTVENLIDLYRQSHQKKQLKM